MSRISTGLRLLAAALLAASGLVATSRTARPEAPAKSTGTTAAVPLFDGLGEHRRPITTASPLAQRYFDQGLNFLFAFNHDQAIRSFRRAAELDPGCAMAWWGVALANGPHINAPFVPADRAKAASDAMARARALSASADPTERALIAALGVRYADPQPTDRAPLDKAYAAAMRGVWAAHPRDADIGALFAESLMDLRPWDLWGEKGEPRPETPEIVETLEAVLKRDPDHPLGLHLYIHAIEASPHPEKAAGAADRLRDLTPGLGHLVHMPSHIDVRLGRWQKSIVANAKAIESDRRYSARESRQGFYRIYRAHNRHMLAFGAMMQGESARADAALRALLAEMPADFRRENAALVDGYHAMPFELLMRFGRWEELLRLPEPDAVYPIARALRHAARGVAYAATDRAAEARKSRTAFRAAVAGTPADAFFGNNAASGLFAVADKLLEGEILFREGKRSEGLAALRAAVAAEDRLRYDEPPDWIQPVRHALGAALLEVGGRAAAAEAETVYREDLRRWPENGWSLYGLSRSLEAQGRRKEASTVRARFEKAWTRADVRLTASCFCQPGKRP